jgi:hypothetical protein
LLPHFFETIDSLKWWRQAKTSGTAEEHDFEVLKAYLCSLFFTTDPVKDARDQFEKLKQIKSAKFYSSVASSVTDICGELRSMSGHK